MASEDTVDISYILPAYGTFTADTGLWTLEWDPNGTSTAFFCVNCTGNGESYADLRIIAPNQTVGDAKLEVKSNATSTLDISTVKWQQIIMNIIARGNPNPTYGGGTIFGYLQGSIYSAYWGNGGTLRTPGVSPGYFEATGFKPLTILSYDTLTTDLKKTSTYAIYAITTTWTNYTLRFIPIHQNWFKIGFIQLQNAGDPWPVTPPTQLLFTTDIQIKQIILQAIRVH